MIHLASNKDVLEQALSALGDNKLRTVLSILGITVGIAAVMTVGTVGQGMRDYVYKELDTYGLRSVWIYRDWGESEPNRVKRQGFGISNDEFELIDSGACCSAVVRVTPMVYTDRRAEPVHVGNTYYDANVEGVGIQYMAINNDKLAAGRAFRKDDMERRKNVAIVGPKVAKELFGEVANPIGKSFRFQKQKFMVIGLLQDKNRDLLNQIGADDYDINGRILVPYTTYQIYMGSKDIHMLQAEAVSLERTGEALDQIESLLRRQHGGRYQYTTETMQGWIETADEIVLRISMFGLLGASLALLVGGLGIMNIMSTSVIERTREIGIRKALGAQNDDILVQFLMEAIVVSAIGGFIGLTLGVVAAYLISLVSGYPLTPSWFMAIIAILVSVIVGLLSGYFPARRAAGLRPVEALRHD